MGQGPEIDRVPCPVSRVPWTDERHVQAWNIEKEREAMTIDDLEAFYPWIK
jgi:hypothetical protein